MSTADLIIKKRVVIFFIVIVLLFFAFSNGGKNTLFFLLKPFEKLSYKISGHPKNYIECQNWQNDKLALEKEINNLKTENTKFQIYQTENQVLKNHLNFLETSKDSFVITNVIGKRIEAGYTWFLLDKGKKDGVNIDLAVVDENGILVGTIIKVEDYISFLQPVFDSHSQITADIIIKGESPNSVSGIVQGEYGLTMKMNYIPLDKPIKTGDIIITSGLEENIRRGLIIGEVAEISKKPNAVFQEATIKSPKSLLDLRIASIILKNTP
ncbi:MAG: rod shape-determining protein MreC [Patescibacteria group bacterium]|nr:rod shape-determining protein MreC [Patescibacteria group bacterium]MDD5164414.1 rod shape-determining protein MreC [Patescibacteria group bacterium]MDD5534609.1 rod shape-determining protein MreC [Patescibacteria group bacterium]